MTVPVFQVDAFTTEPFGGNPAAIALLDRDAPDAWMQALAAEMNLSETAFPQRRSDGDWDLRWFTPAAEVDLCGHATLAAAHLLFEQGTEADSVTFHTRSGPLHCRRSDGGVVMDFPAAPAEPIEVTSALAAALGTDVVAAGATFDVIAEVADAAAVRDLSPDIAAVAGIDTRAVIVTAAGDDADTDVVSRVFAPRVGIAEDPVTGSAHCVIGPWWQSRLGDTLRAHQASARGGRLVVRTRGDRVEIEGHGVTVMEATLTVDVA